MIRYFMQCTVKTVTAACDSNLWFCVIFASLTLDKGNVNNLVFDEGINQSAKLYVVSG